MTPPNPYQENVDGTRWEPDQYLKFSDLRLRPALELLHRIPTASPETVYDLGCGAGQVTRMMADRWPAAAVYGVDHSREMLVKAAAEPGTAHWIEADLRTWSPDRPPDVIYSNASLHWIDGHNDLFPRLARMLSPGGCLAVQMPLSWDLPSHRLMRETLGDGGPGGRPLGTEELRRSMARKWVEDTTFYYDILAPHTQGLDIWETGYLQILEGEHAVYEWVKGTGLRPILSGLAGKEKERFIKEYKKRLNKTYPVRRDRKTLYPFRRLFVVATV